jgi:helicase required for RNAi-mediated heterochromatin assembly 1
MSKSEFETRYLPRRPNCNKNRRDDSFSNKTKTPVSAANPDIRNYVNRMQKNGAEEGWLASPEIPTSQEIMCVKGEIDLEENCINLEPNHVDGPWPSVGDYLRTHYELLREDVVALLRDSVAYLRNKPSMTDTKNIYVYDQVKKSSLTKNYFLFAY